MEDTQRRANDKVLTVSTSELGHRLHSRTQHFLLDCRPVLAFNSSHISGAVNINFTSMMKKRFLSGKIGLSDLVSTEDAKEKFKVSKQYKVVHKQICLHEFNMYIII